MVAKPSGEKPRRSRSKPTSAKPEEPSQDGDCAFSYTAASSFQNGRQRSFLWEKHVLLAALTVIEGQKGAGKSSLLAALAADVTGGPSLAKTGRVRHSHTVLWFAGEEDPVLDVKPKLHAAGADLSKVFFPGRNEAGTHTRRLSLPADGGILCDLVKKTSSWLVILDPWSSCLPPGTSTSDPVTSRQTMEVLAHIGQATGASVVITRNFRKDTSGGALASGIGSSEVANVSRAVIQLRPHPDAHRRYVCCVAACNAFAPPLPRAYDLVPKDGSVAIQWGEQLDLTADQLAEGDITSSGRDERRDAICVLASVLAGHWVPFQDLMQEAKRAGICERTLRAVKAEHRIRSRKVDEVGRTHWEWGPPESLEGGKPA